MNSQECGATKICKGCEEELSAQSFTTYFDKRKNKSYTKGKCKSCVNKQEAITAAAPKRRAVKRIEGAKRRAEPEYKEYMKEYSLRYKIINREKIATQKKEYRKNPEVIKREKARLKKVYAENTDEIQAKRVRFYDDNPERKEARNARARQNYRDNPSYATEKASRRKRGIKQATPAWYDEQKVIELRKEVKRLNASTHETYNLDHIVPINGKLVSGLHCHQNMQILTEKENKIKAAKHIS